jgi:hypothetical protein
MRCPEITTVTYDISPHMSEVSGLPVVEEPARTTAPAPLPRP